MEEIIAVRHVSLAVKAAFESFTEQIERALGRFHPTLLEGLASDPAAVQARLQQVAGEEGLMLFAVQDHGRLLGLDGAVRRAKQYVLGNPLIALTMTRHDIRAGLYAPLRMLVYEDGDGATRIDFDQPSSLFGQFGNPEVTTVARSLDAKLANLIRKAEVAASASLI